MIRSFRATLVKLKEMFSWYAIGNRVEIPPYPFHTSLGPRNIRFNLHRVKNLHSLAMRIHPGISPKRKINTIEIIFFKKCPSLLRHSLTSKQETKNIPEKTTLQANVTAISSAVRRPPWKNTHFLELLQRQLNSSSHRGKIPSSGSQEAS